MTIDPKNENGKREDVCPAKKQTRLGRGARRDRKCEAKVSARNTGAASKSLPAALLPEALHREFPKGASEWVDSVSRRGFLKVMGASMAMAGMTGCVKLPLEPIVSLCASTGGSDPRPPYVLCNGDDARRIRQPAAGGKPLGRPQKLKATTGIPPSLGGTDIFAQASILGMYDPDRSQSVVSLGRSALLAVVYHCDRGSAYRTKGAARRGHSHSDADHYLRPPSPINCGTS